MKKKVLVVDDNKNNVRLLTDILDEAGYTVFTADNGQPVLDMTYHLKPDAILLDIMMPMMDGFQVCELLKKDHETKDIPVLIITARTDARDLHKAFELGAFDYVKKPVHEMELLARLKSAIHIKEHQDMLKAMATKDGLTGLFNHALLLELLHKELMKQERQNRNLAFIMMDIDYFKKVNDAYGHTSGDIILKELADVISNRVRTGDVIGRYGGEEFSIILSDIGLTEALNLCERIRLEVQEHPFILPEKTAHITISMGMYFKTPGDGIHPGDVVIKADEALYTAKNNGRNRVEVYGQNRRYSG